MEIIVISYGDHVGKGQIYELQAVNFTFVWFINKIDVLITFYRNPPYSFILKPATSPSTYYSEGLEM
jgi:hypothetical protein